MTDWRNRIKETRTVRVEDIQPHPANWRRHPQAQESAIRGLLAQVGIVAPLVAYESEQYGGLVLLDGHLRQETGGEWPCVVLDVSDSEADIILATFDPITGLAEMDTGALAELLGRVDMEAIEDDGLAGLLEELATASGAGGDAGEPVDAEPEIDRAGELAEEYGTALGQLWELGKHRLLIGDSTNGDAVARLMGGDLATLVWTDPPYGVKYGDKLDAANPIAHRVRSIENDDLPAAELEEFIRKTFKNAAAHTAPGAALYAACPAGTLLPTAIAAFVGSGFDFRWQLVWVKDSLVLSRADYHFRHENILYGWKPDGAHWFVDDRTQDSIFEVPRPKVSEEHPTMKPVALVAQMIRNSSKANAIVYEPFSGSGTTILACEQLGRNCRAVELSPAYAAVAIKRWEDATGLTAVRIENAPAEAEAVEG